MIVSWDLVGSVNLLQNLLLVDVSSFLDLCAFTHVDRIGVLLSISADNLTNLWEPCSSSDYNAVADISERAISLGWPDT